MIIRGIDTLEFGLDIENYKETFLPLLRELKYFKDQGQQTGKALEYEINGINFTVEKSGMKFYAYRLICKDFIIGFAEKQVDENSPVRVKFLSAFLWSYGYKEAYIKFLEWFELFESDILGSRLSRVDICVDTDEVKFVESDVNGFVTRANSKTKHFVSEEYMEGRQFSGFTIGRGDIMARIYDKTIEIKKSGKVWFEHIWLENGWDKEKPIWRVEFQVRRKVLKELEINQVENIWLKEEGFWMFLTNNWLRLVSDSNDNVSRRKEKMKWKIIREADIKYIGSKLIRQKVKQGDLKRLLDQATGIMFAIGALNDCEDLNSVLSILKKSGQMKLQKEGLEYFDKVLNIKLKYLDQKMGLG